MLEPQLSYLRISGPLVSEDHQAHVCRDSVPAAYKSAEALCWVNLMWRSLKDANCIVWYVLPMEPIHGYAEVH